jgi:hypothetical protein
LKKSLTTVFASKETGRFTWKIIYMNILSSFAAFSFERTSTWKALLAERMAQEGELKEGRLLTLWA